MTQSTDEALRVVGHLLEHHPTTHAAARDVRGAAVDVFDAGANCYCLSGAIALVASRLHFRYHLVSVAAARLLLDGLAPELSPGARLAIRWDCDGNAWRAEVVEKLKRAGL